MKSESEREDNEKRNEKQNFKIKKMLCITSNCAEVNRRLEKWTFYDDGLVMVKQVVIKVFTPVLERAWKRQGNLCCTTGHDGGSSSWGRKEQLDYCWTERADCTNVKLLEGCNDVR